MSSLEGRGILAERRPDPFPVLRLQKARGSRELPGEDQQSVRGRRDAQPGPALEWHGVCEQPSDLGFGQPPVRAAEQLHDVRSDGGRADPAAANRHEAGCTQPGFERAAVAIAHEQIPVSTRRRR